MYPGPGGPVFRFIGELLGVNLQGEKTVLGCLGRRRSPPETKLLENPMRPFLGCDALFLEPLIQPLVPLVHLMVPILQYLCSKQ